MSIDLGEINYLAVVAAVVLNMTAGALWYSPVLWAKPWMALTGHTDMSMGGGSAAIRGYAISILASLIIALALAIVIQLARANTIGEGLLLGLLAGVGFVLTTHAANYAFEQKPLKLYLTNAGYPVISFLSIGALIGVWQ
ncbi:MAG: DUF1761 domain-containing protein [Chloroflexi bacterium]|nr:DUF1761 domain-containing protein [Chloroflexota bacterium]